MIGQTKDHAHTHTRTHARTQRGEGNSNYSRYRAAAGRSSWRARRLGLRYHRPRPLACRSPGWSRACVLVCKWRIKHTVRCTTVQYHYSTALPNRMATLARTSETDQDLASPLPFSNSRPIHSHALLLLLPPTEAQARKTPQPSPRALFSSTPQAHPSPSLALPTDNP